jgi:GNAT superfamily N-acetyltransferase
MHEICCRCLGTADMTGPGSGATQQRLTIRDNRLLKSVMYRWSSPGATRLLCILREPTVEELPALSALCLRSKAAWGYDNHFMEACRGELTIEPCDLRLTSIAVAEEDGKIVGVAQVKVVGREADLLKLFVEPTTLRRGIGRALFVWATDQATSGGANRLAIEADPDAVPFYRRMGAEDCGFAPSSSIAGRMLPRLVKELRST